MNRNKKRLIIQRLDGDQIDTVVVYPYRTTNIREAETIVVKFNDEKDVYFDINQIIVNYIDVLTGMKYRGLYINNPTGTVVILDEQYTIEKYTFDLQCAQWA